MNKQSTPDQNKNKGYGKRPLWQWILLYLVIGGLIYLLIYVLFIANGANGDNGSGGLYG